MKKVIKLENLGCANCAAKMEREISKINGINSVNVNFITQKMTIDSEDVDFDSIVKAIEKIINKIEPYCKLKI